MTFDGSLESSALALQCGKKSALRNPNFDSLSATQSLSLNFCFGSRHFLTSQRRRCRRYQSPVHPRQ